MCLINFLKELEGSVSTPMDKTRAKQIYRYLSVFSRAFYLFSFFHLAFINWYIYHHEQISPAWLFILDFTAPFLFVVMFQMYRRFYTFAPINSSNFIKYGYGTWLILFFLIGAFQTAFGFAVYELPVSTVLGRTVTFGTFLYGINFVMDIMGEFFLRRIRVVIQN